MIIRSIIWRFAVFAIGVSLITLNGCTTLTNPPIELHAKLVDQHGEPAPGIKVNYHATIAPLIQAPMVGPGTEDYQTKSDSNGRINLRHSGIAIWIDRLEHPAYVFMLPGYKIIDERYHLPPNSIWPTGEMSEKNPVIIPVWKRENAAALAIGSQRLQTMHGQVERMTISNTPMELEVLWNTPGSDRDPGAWSIRIRMINGEIQPTDDAFPFEAPNSGYRSEWIGGGVDTPGKSVTTLVKDFYVVDTQKKNYGRLSVYLHPYFRDKNKMEVTSWINPTGGRSLLNDTPTGN